MSPLQDAALVATVGLTSDAETLPRVRWRRSLAACIMRINRLVSGSMDHTVKIWDTVEGQELLSLPLGSRPDDGVQRVLVTPDGRRILATDGAGSYASGSLGTVLVWSAPEKSP